MAQIPDKVTATFKSTKPTSLPKWTRQVINRTEVQGSTTNCSIIFDIPEPIGPPVFLYYRLTNFYQNHRRYVSSLDMDQLKGVAVDNNTIKSSACDPLTLDGATGKAYYPCGLIANSIFNDTINSPVLINNDTYFMTNNGIAWPSDKELIQQTKYNQWQVVPPPNWRNQYPNGYTNDNPIPNLNEDEAFMVWLRTAGLPTFSKLSRRNDTTAMASGTYQLEIYDCTCLSLDFSLFVITLSLFYPSFLSLSCLLFFLCTHLIPEYRLSCHRIWRNEVHPHLDKDRHGREEPIHGDCLCSCGRDLCRTRCCIYCCTFD
jgi:cell cycle control protein 50